MSSVEIKIKGVKSVRRGKPRAKRGKRRSKAGLLEKTKMPEYSYRGLPYNYVSPPQPTYIDRPAPLIQQQQQPSIDYKPMMDRLTQQLALSRIKEESSREQNIMPRVEEVGVPSRIDEPVSIPSKHIPKVGETLVKGKRTLKIVKDTTEEVKEDKPKRTYVRKSAPTKQDK